MNAGDRLRDGYGLEAREDVLDEGAPASSHGSGRSMDSVQQLAHRDDADRALLLRGDPVESVRPPFSLDQDVRVDQDGQELSTGPASARIARRSFTKSSSTGGADRMSSRKRSAESSRTLGGPMTATVAPLRVISISSPAVARFRRSEKLRAASVAVSRAM